MARLSVVVRDAEPEDAASLIDLCDQCVRAADKDGGETLSSTTGWYQPVVAEAAEAISGYVQDPTQRLLLALLDGEVVGMVAVAMRPLSPIHTRTTMAVDNLIIAPQYRRKYVATTLMSAAVRWAEESDCESVFTAAPAVSRDAHRFLTRLRFSQVATVRVAQVSTLRSRFAGLATSSRDTGRLIAVRRTLRRRHAKSPSAKSPSAKRPSAKRPGAVEESRRSSRLRPGG